MLAVSFIVCASMIMFACGVKKDVNIRSIEVYGDVPEFIIVDKFDEANIQIKVTYEDDTDAVVKVTTGMISEDDLHYLSEPGEYTITILFKGATTTIDIKMVEKSAVHTVKFYNGNGEFIMSELVLDGENATGPSEEWIKVQGYNFIGWDVNLTNITKDTNAYGVYNKIESNMSTQDMKSKFVSALDYYIKHDHVLSAICEDEDGLIRIMTNYHYNDGDYSAQLKWGDGYGDISNNQYVEFRDVGEYCAVQYADANYSYVDDADKEMTRDIALWCDPYDGCLDDLMATKQWEYSVALYGNKNVYTAISTFEKYGEQYVVTVVYDNEKLLNYSSICEDDGYTRGTHYYIDYSTVAYTTNDYTSRINIEDYKTKLANQIEYLTNNTWTATHTSSQGSKTITHTAGENNATVGDETYALTTLIPNFPNNAWLYGVIVETTGATLYCETTLEKEYTFDGDSLVSISVKGNGVEYTITF